jgi:hypothetical protein
MSKLWFAAFTLFFSNGVIRVDVTDQNLKPSYQECRDSAEQIVADTLKRRPVIVAMNFVCLPQELAGRYSPFNRIEPAR